MALFIIVITGDFGDIPLRALAIASLFLLALASCSRNSISPNGGAFRPFTLSLAILLLYFFLGLFRGLFSLGALLGLVYLIFGLWGFFVNLLVPGIETYLQVLFFLVALLM